MALFLKAEPRIYAYIRSQVLQRVDAEDILQETAVVLWTKFDEFQPDSNFLAWAYQVARFKVRHYFDRHAHRRQLFTAAFLDIVAAKIEESSGEFAELEPILVRCMERLKPADRDVVQRCYSMGATIKTVAAELGRPVDTIKSILKRARRALYECILRDLDKERRQ